MAFNDEQIKVIKAFCGTLIAKLDDLETEALLKTKANVIKKHPSKVLKFSKFDLSENEDFIKIFTDKLVKCFPRDKLVQINLIFNFFAKSSTSLLLTGYFKPFYELDRKQREFVLQKWSKGFKFYRNIFSALTILFNVIYWTSFDKYFETIGYPGPDPEANGEKFTSKINSFPNYEFIQVPPEGLELQFDVVVIGSGAGGGVVSAQLAKAGYNVLVIEKGKYYHQNELSLKQAESLDNLYESNGFLFNEDKTMYILSASTFGGGTTINYSASLKLPHYVRKEWAAQGLTYFLSDEFNESIEAVEKRMGVSSDAIIHNENNKILIEGCKKFGYHCGNIPQNTAGYHHQCGWCTFGCKYGEKQGSLMTWLRDARDAGAKFIDNCYVENILIKNRKAVGVKAIVNGNRALIIHSKKVIVSCGAIHSPALLRRSGLKNKNIGKNLYLHPLTMVTGFFPDKEINPYSGSIMTSVSDAVENVDGDNYGAKIETSTFHPLFLVTFLPWRSALNHKQRMLQINHFSSMLIISRDKIPGKITIDSNGRPRIHYSISNHDSKSIVEGIIAGLNIHVAAGAKTVMTPQFAIEEFEPAEKDPFNDPRYKKYIEKVREIGVEENASSIGSAHQMGTW
ncbi:14026_t:CDS:2 [Dentiscutata erythropus]|uniref:Long-chain-alcohol oxidase n=1 Tax=Dentiscutata erythropus TaxID=1348616 RepID=A0A9N8ZFI5_9GLOM|nr:14026_t:CDS:2 [Dentiscutata erythropus]